jgi:TonB-linked SusC/RagA family outer membrane protein
MLFSFAITFAQEKTITGTVSDSSGLPLPGATVLVKGTSSGTGSDFDGKYSIKATQGSTLVYSFVGYSTLEMKVGTSNSINVTLVEDAAALEEVVITGYASVAKKKESIAASRLTSETISNRPNASFVQTLTGQVAGLDISTASGQPGANSLIELRGANSINGNTEPLFLMDGIPINEDNFRSLNPNDIESVVVLKDAGATAIYGSRGANGVILIKTKRGTKGAGLQVSYTGITSFSNLQYNNERGYNLFDSASGYLSFERDAGIGRGAGSGLGPVFPGTGVPLTDAEIAAAPTTDWIDFFLDTGITQNHTLTFSTGSENASSFTSLGYFNQEGLLASSNLQRFNLRNNVSGTTKNQKLNYTTSISVNFSKNDEPTSIGTNGVNQNPLFGAYGSLPYLTPEDNPGSRTLAQSFVLGYAPFYTIDKLATSVALQEEMKLIAGFSASYKLTDDLVASVNSGVDYEHVTFLDFSNPISRNQLRFNDLVDGTQDQQTTRRMSFQNTTSLNYNKTLGKHSFGLGGYLEYFKAHFRTFGFRANGLNPKTLAPGDGSGFIPDAPDNDALVDIINADKLDAGLLSYFGTFNYDFDSKYGISGTMRRDASYRFAETNRWGTFWSLAAFWNIADEDFMSGSAVNSLKLRGSYGLTGNQRITGNSYWSGADLSRTFFNTGSGYGDNQAIFRGQIGNSTLRWETVIQTNIGVDFGVWNNRLRGAFDVYQKETIDLFQNKPLSAVTGAFVQNANVGSLFNRGFDFDLHYDLFKESDFSLTLNFVGNYNQSELQDIPDDTGEILGIGRNGGILGERKLVRYAGVNPANGNLLYLDIDGNTTEAPDFDRDAVWTETNNVPDFLGSFGFDMDYKGFFLSAQFNYEVGITRYDFDYANALDRDQIGQFNLSQDLLRAWTPENRVTDIPSLDATNLEAINGGDTNRFIKNSDYLRLRFLQFGYNVPQTALENTAISRVRIFGNAENLFTWSEFRGFDPSARAGSRSFPTPRILSVGLEIGF